MPMNIKKTAARTVLFLEKYAVPVCFFVGPALFLANSVLNYEDAQTKDDQTRLQADILLTLGTLFCAGGVANAITALTMPKENEMPLLLADEPDAVSNEQNAERDETATTVVPTVEAEAVPTAAEASRVHKISGTLAPVFFLVGSLGLIGLDAYGIYSARSSGKPVPTATIFNLSAAVCFVVGSTALIVVSNSKDPKVKAWAEKVAISTFAIGSPLFLASDLLQNKEEFNTVPAKIGGATSFVFTFGADLLNPAFFALRATGAINKLKHIAADDYVSLPGAEGRASTPDPVV